MKSIDTLVPDIQDLFRGETDVFSPENVLAFGATLGSKIAARTTEVKSPNSLRISNLGTPCSRKLWYSINRPEFAEVLEPSTRLKFLYGDILEEMLLFLAREAGHDVQFEQETVSLYDVPGHIDGVIDGCLVDVKSASSYSFVKFRDGLSVADDSFGYLTQLDSYLHATSHLQLDNVGAFLVIDKTLGHICLDKHPKSMVDYKSRVDQVRRMLEGPLPPRAYSDEAFGKSGNRALNFNCSYCQFKKTCWPGLRVFAYAGKPVFLTKVVRTPDVTEITH